MNSSETHNMLSLSGDLTFSSASEKRDELLAALKKTENLVVDLSEIREFDCIGMQLLYAAVKSGNKQNKRIHFTGGANTERFLKFLKFSGLGNTLPLEANENSNKGKEK